MGRPTKFSQATADLIVTLIEGGVPRDHAFRAAGIAASTGYKWLAWGRSEADEIDPDDHTRKELVRIATDRNITTKTSWRKDQIADAINDARSPYAEFADRVEAADSRFMASAIGKMREKGDGDWRMWDRLLERRFAELRLGYDPNQLPEEPAQAGTPDDAEEKLDRAEEIRIKMLEPPKTGTDG